MHLRVLMNDLKVITVKINSFGCAECDLIV